MSSHTSAEVVVVGGGLVGAAAAYELVCSGADVLLVDASHPGRASDAGAGILSPATSADPDERFYAFSKNAASHARTLMSRLVEDGIDLGADVFSECGALVVALAEHEDKWFSEVADRAKSRDEAVTEVSPAQATEMFPPLGRTWRALLNPLAARVDGRALRNGLTTAAQQRGARVLCSEAIDVAVKRGRATAVFTQNEIADCGALLIATGAWSSFWGDRLGTALRVSPTKGQIVHVVLPNGGSETQPLPSDRWPIVHPVLNFYLVPWPGGRVACGGTFEADAGFDTRPTAAGVRDLLRECLAIAPGLAEATLHEVRVGLRPTSVDDRPVLGRVPGTANVHVCTGHGANGLLLGPYSAALVAAGLLDGRGGTAGTAGTAGDIPYDMARFVG